MKETAIIGLGNLIKGDDGVGIHLAKEIRNDVPKEVDVIDGGTAGLNILNYLEQYEKIVIIDAINLGHKIGEIIELTPSDILGETDLNLSAHDIDFVDSLQISKEIGIDPEIKIIGIEIGEIKTKELSMELSKEIREKIPELKQRVLKELN